MNTPPTDIISGEISYFLYSFITILRPSPYALTNPNILNIFIKLIFLGSDIPNLIPSTVKSPINPPNEVSSILSLKI